MTAVLKSFLTCSSPWIYSCLYLNKYDFHSLAWVLCQQCFASRVPKSIWSVDSVTIKITRISPQFISNIRIKFRKYRNHETHSILSSLTEPHMDRCVKYFKCCCEMIITLPVLWYPGKPMLWSTPWRGRDTLSRWRAWRSHVHWTISETENFCILTNKNYYDLVELYEQY